MDDLDRHAWLYIRGEGSIHMTRVQFRVRVFGPGATEHFHLFTEAAAVEEFLRWYGDALTRDGWVLQAYVDRRAVSRDTTRLPPAGERRSRRIALTD